MVKGAALCLGVLGVPLASEINQLQHVGNHLGERQRKREFRGDRRSEVIWAQAMKVSNEALYEGLRANDISRGR